MLPLLTYLDKDRVCYLTAPLLSLKSRVTLLDRGAEGWIGHCVRHKKCYLHAPTFSPNLLKAQSVDYHFTVWFVN